MCFQTSRSLGAFRIRMARRIFQVSFFRIYYSNWSRVLNEFLFWTYFLKEDGFFLARYFWEMYSRKIITKTTTTLSMTKWHNLKGFRISKNVNYSCITDTIPKSKSELFIFYFLVVRVLNDCNWSNDYTDRLSFLFALWLAKDPSGNSHLGNLGFHSALLRHSENTKK